MGIINPEEVKKKVEDINVEELDRLDLIEKAAWLSTLIFGFGMTWTKNLKEGRGTTKFSKQQLETIVEFLKETVLKFMKISDMVDEIVGMKKDDSKGIGIV